MAQHYCATNRTRVYEPTAPYLEPYDHLDDELDYRGPPSVIAYNGNFQSENSQWFHNNASSGHNEDSGVVSPSYGHNIIYPACYQSTGHHCLLDLNVSPCVQAPTTPGSLPGLSSVPTVSLYHHYHHHHHHVTGYGTCDGQLDNKHDEQIYKPLSNEEYKPNLTQLTTRTPSSKVAGAPRDCGFASNGATTNNYQKMYNNQNIVDEEPLFGPKQNFAAKRKHADRDGERVQADASYDVYVGQPASIRRRSATAATTKFQCFICGNNYCRQSTLKAHMRQHSGEKPYICTICGKNFTQSANLNAHQRVHTGEKPFSCPICCRPFSQSSSLMTHKRTHTGERPYQCAMCNKAFTDSSTLTKHIRTHTLVKPYSCRICHFSFSQSGNLNRHMKTHMKKQN